MTKTRHQILTTLCILLFAFCIFCTFGAVSASAAEAAVMASGDCSAEGSSVQWKLDDTGTLTIYGKGAMTDYSSTSSCPWYDYEDVVTTVVVERGITHIGENSFAYFDSLTTVTVADTVETIGESAFMSCDNLTSVKLPDSVRSIGSSAFSDCDNLTEIKLPMSLKSIYSYTFYSCKSLTSVIIPNSLESISWNAFKLVSSTEPIPFVTVHYSGTKAEWNEINIDSEGNIAIKSGTRHYCTETSWKAATCTTEGQEGGIYCSYCQKYVKEPNTLPINPDNHKSFDIETGLCGCGQQFEARIGDTPYATFADAFAAAKEGDTVVACTGKSGGTFAIPENAIFDGGEHEFSAMLENRGEIIGGKYTGNITNYGKITGGTYESLRYMLYNTGEIAGGVFDISVEHHTGKITGGRFLHCMTVYSDIDDGHFAETATVDFAADEMGEYHLVINGGIFDCDMLTSGKIIAGTFNGQITNEAEIYGGTFSGEVTNRSKIMAGVFNGEVTNYRGRIYGGEFNAKVTNGVLDENGALAALGHIYGGSFNSGILNNEKSLITNIADDYTFTLGESFVMTNVGGLITCEEHFKASDATCTAQAVCRICGSYGELTDHTWTDATCESPKTCSVCKITEGEALGHDYIDATTEAPKTCKNCGATDGEPLPKPEAPVTPDEPAETNWFIRIWNAILDFFRRLFGIEKRK